MIDFYRFDCHYTAKYSSEPMYRAVEAALASAGIVGGLAADGVTPFYLFGTPE